MTRYRVLKPDQSYSFSQYFDLPFTVEDILHDLGYSFQRAALTLPQSKVLSEEIQHLSIQIERNLRRSRPVAEISRREAVIAPILFELCESVDTQLNSEYSLTINNWLKGTVDYYIPKQNKLIVIEAKQSDLEKGFTQLAVELIAFDQWIDSTPDEQPILYGAITSGLIWKFGMLNRSNKQITEDQNLYRIPNELEIIFQSLAGILVNK